MIYDIAVEKSQTKIKKAVEIINEYIGSICTNCKDCPLNLEKIVLNDKCYRDVCGYDLINEAMKNISKGRC